MVVEFMVTRQRKSTCHARSCAKTHITGDGLCASGSRSHSGILAPLLGRCSVYGGLFGGIVADSFNHPATFFQPSGLQAIHDELATARFVWLVRAERLAKRARLVCICFRRLTLRFRLRSEATARQAATGTAQPAHPYRRGDNADKRCRTGCRRSKPVPRTDPAPALGSHLHQRSGARRPLPCLLRVRANNRGLARL